MTLTRRTPIRRGKPLPRKPIKPKKRSASEYARIYGSRCRVLFVNSLPCLAGERFGTADCGSPMQNHHIENGGAGRKADFDKVVPLCILHHEQCHHIGRQTFERVYAIDLEKAAAETERLWSEWQTRTEDAE